MARRRLRTISREERVLNELKRIASGEGNVARKLKAMELLGQHIGFFIPKMESLVERSEMTFLQKSKKQIKLISSL